MPLNVGNHLKKDAIMIYKAIISLSFLAIAGLTSLFSQDSLQIQNVDMLSGTKLPALVINGDCYSPAEGVDVSEAKAIIIAELKKEGVKGDINASINITEITSRESWQNIGIQLYRVKLDYSWLDGVAILKNKNVLTILKGMPIESVFFADLDEDSTYEVYANYFFGSGIVSMEIGGYNIALNENYHLSLRMEKDLHLFVDKGTLMAAVKPFNKTNEKPIVKKVHLKKIDTKYELSIE